MDEHDRTLLDKQMRALNPAPRQDGVLILAIVTVFFGGVIIGDLLAGSNNTTGQTNERIAAMVPVQPALIVPQ